MTDVARVAGVGIATVDRVLNERANVSEAVRRKVINAAREVGLKRVLPEVYHPMVRINLILARPNLPLLMRMAEEFRSIARNARHSAALHITTLPNEEPETIAHALKTCTCNAVVVYAQDHPLIRGAIADLDRRGVPVVTIISDLPASARLAYAGTDHYAAGRSAGFFLSRMLPQGGRLVVLCNHLRFQSHADRVAGLQDYLSEAAPDLKISRIIEGHDDRELARTMLEKAFRDEPETVAVYNVGAANLGVRAAIEKDLLINRPTFVGHELTVHTAKMLRDKVMTLTIDQSPRLQAQFAFDVLMDWFGYEDVPVSSPYVSNVPIVLYGPEYIPPGFD